MSDITIGLDFGTHQSKVCFEDATDPRNRFYTFFRFAKPDGTSSFFLPSVVQVNKDRTLSYGFVNEDDALFLRQDHAYAKPSLKSPKQPVFKEMPAKPEPPRIPSINQFLYSLPRKERSLYVQEYVTGKGKKAKFVRQITNRGREAYEKHKQEIERRQRLEYFSWQFECQRIEKENHQIEKKYDKACKETEKEYQKKLAKWEAAFIDVKAVYRYFKIATFSKSYPWTGDISPKLLSTWYIAYILFTLFEKLPDDSPFQMGIPETIGDKEYAEFQRRAAEDVFYAAYRLYIHFRSKEAFLKAHLEELLALTNFNNEEIANGQADVLILPEAFAGLLTITQQGKVGIGMTLLVDIGGGSTDISLFNIVSSRYGDLPNISHIISLHRGLNHIFRMYRNDNPDLSMERIRNRFNRNPEAFSEYVAVFLDEIRDLVQKRIYAPLYMAAYNQGVSKDTIMAVLSHRPVIFSGGGGVYEMFQRPISIFSDTVSVSKDLLSMKNVSNKRITDAELSILSVAYGLSIPQIREPVMTPLGELFTHIHIEEEIKPQHYEHMMSDID